MSALTRYRPAVPATFTTLREEVAARWAQHGIPPQQHDLALLRELQAFEHAGVMYRHAEDLEREKVRAAVIANDHSSLDHARKSEEVRGLKIANDRQALLLKHEETAGPVSPDLARLRERYDALLDDQRRLQGELDAERAARAEADEQIATFLQDREASR